MRYLAVANYEALLHYKDRAPTFVRLYTRLLESYEFLKLPDVTRGHLMQIWLLAARLDNKIPADHEYIAKQIHARSKIDLPLLVNGGFLFVFDQSASNSLAEGQNPSAEMLASASNSVPPDPGKSTELLASRYQNGAEKQEVASNSLADASTLPIMDLRTTGLMGEDLQASKPLLRESEEDQGQVLSDSASNLLAPASSAQSADVTSLVPRSRRAAPELPAIIGPRTLTAIRAQLAQVLDEVAQGTRKRVTKEQARELLAGIVIGYWMAKFNHTRALVDPPRKRLVVKQLEQNGDNLDELLYALDGAARDAYVNGDKDGTKHDEIEFLLRNRSNIERYANVSKKYRDGVAHPTAEKYKAILLGQQMSANGNNGGAHE